MVLLRSGMAVVLAAFSLLGSTVASPLVDKLRSLTPEARDLLKRSTPAAPRFVVYDDAFVSPLPSAADLKVSTYSRTSTLADAAQMQGYSV